MGVEAGVSSITDLNESWPLSTDERSTVDDHLRAVKTALKSLIATPWPAGIVQLGFPASVAAGALLKVNAGATGFDTLAQSTFAVAAKGVTNGDTHDHAGGDGAEIDHVNLGNKGTNTHAQIDTHIASTANPHTVTADQVLPSQGGNSGKFLSTNGATASWETVAAAGGGLRSVQVFTSSGTWNKPAGVTRVRILCIGGGGSGCVGGTYPGTGGGAGAYAEKVLDVSAISSRSVTVGAGGSTGGTGIGGATSFGSDCVAAGGSYGSNSTTAGGAGGTVAASTGDVRIAGAAGECYALIGAIYTTGLSVSHRGGDGANSVFGGAGRGSSSTGSAGTANTGAGGAGGAPTNYAAGNGGSGICIVWEY